MTNSPQKAIFAAGCFWYVQDAFIKLPGVIGAVAGYTGGHTESPTYEDVISHTTGHAEAVEVTFDPEKISYKELLDKFWEIHDPTTLNRQGLDIGDSYRSVIFYSSEQQKAEAEKSLKEAQKRFKNKIVTEIAPAGQFYKAEEYHQRFYEKHGISACPLPQIDMP